jgi:hypothetical protein
MPVRTRIQQPHPRAEEGYYCGTVSSRGKNRHLAPQSRNHSLNQAVFHSLLLKAHAVTQTIVPKIVVECQLVRIEAFEITQDGWVQPCLRDIRVPSPDSGRDMFRASG